VQTTGGDYEMLAGNLASIGVGAIVAVTSSLIVCVVQRFSDMRSNVEFSGQMTLTGKPPVTSINPLLKGSRPSTRRRRPRAIPRRSQPK